MVTPVTMYRTEDGKTFANKEEATFHETRFSLLVETIYGNTGQGVSNHDAEEAAKAVLDVFDVIQRERS